MVTFLTPSFLLKQLSAAVFALFLLALIVLTYFFYPKSVAFARYDFMLLCALCFQAFMLARGLESKKEFLVILLFHVLAMCMEVFKVHMSSWLYPERFAVGIFGVPLFAGFMYSAVGSYLVRLHGQFAITYTHLPRSLWLLVLALACYVNFFTHHFVWDARWLLITASVLLFWRCRVGLHHGGSSVHVWVLLPLWLVAVLVWVAENIATYSRVWHYPNQVEVWQMVSLSKISSWYLLLLLSLALVLVFLSPQDKAHMQVKNGV